MADSSLIDFQGAAQMAMGLGQLEQTQRMNDIREANSQISQEQLAFQQKKQQQDVMGKAYDEIGKFEKSPFYAGLQPDRKIQLAYTKGTLLEGLSGNKVNLPSKEEMAGSFEAVNTLLDTIKSGTPDQQLAAMNYAAASAPDWWSGVSKELKANGELTAQMQEIDTKVQINKEKLEKLKLANAKANLQQNFFGEHLAGLTRTVALANDPRFAQDFRKVQSFDNPEPKQIYLSMHPDFRTAFEQSLQQEALPLPMMGLALGEEVRSRTDAIRDLQAKTGEVPADLEEELSGYEAVRKARALQAEFVADPYNKDKFRALQKAQQDIRILNGAAGKQLSNIADQRTQIMQSKLDMAESAKQNLAKAQVEFGQLSLQEQTPQNAAKIAGKYANVLPKEVLEAVKNPNQPLVAINQKQETAEAARVGDEYGKQYSAMQQDAMEATTRLAKFDRMEKLLQGVTTGKLTPAITKVQALAESLGVTVDTSLPAKQAFESMAGEVALGLRNPSGGAGMPGALSDKDLEFLNSMTPGLGKTTEGNRLIIETGRALAKRSQEVAKMARAYRKAHGHFDEGFLDELQTYSDAHPLFDGKVMPGSQPATAPAAGPFSDADKEARYQEWKRSQGQ